MSKVVVKKHKVVKFGHIFHKEDHEPESLEAKYQFTHQRVNGTISEGYIPVDFISSLPCETGDLLYLFTREGAADAGPEFQVSWQTEKNVLGEYSTNVDSLWGNVISYMEKKALVSEEDLEYLDADPFVLFGIDDPITQKALRKLDRHPVLLCPGLKPDIESWFRYLLADPDLDLEHKWVIEAFAESELPVPWTSYKGVGSIVCFTNNKTGVTTWHHPMYEYFQQLLEFCRNAPSVDDILRMRVHRLIWNYEVQHCQVGIAGLGPPPQYYLRLMHVLWNRRQAGGGGTEAASEPLISPLYLELLAAIFDVELAEEGFLVRILKSFLKDFAHNYRQTEDIDRDIIVKCVETIAMEREKWAVMREEWRNALSFKSPVDALDLDRLANGKIQCIECTVPALIYCLDCMDYYCLECHTRLHQKGHRAQHVPFQLVLCQKCNIMPAKLRCRSTMKALCHGCYAMRHVTEDLPGNQRESRPEKINYQAQKERMINAEREE